MADLKISQLTSATLPLAGTEVLPIVQSSSTKKVATDDLTVKNVRSNATTGILQIAGPGAGTTRTMTTPDANFTAARTDAAQTFASVQTFAEILTGKVNSGEGDSGSIANGATANIITLPDVGVYLVTARQSGSANGGIRAAAIVAQGSSTNGLTSLAAVGGATLVAGTGFGVDLTNTAGGALVVRWSYTKLSS